MFYASAARFDVIGNLVKFWVFECSLSGFTEFLSRQEFRFSRFRP